MYQLKKVFAQYLETEFSNWWLFLCWWITFMVFISFLPACVVVWSVLIPAFIALQASSFGKKIEQLLPALQNYLKEGMLRDEFILDNIPRLMTVMRDSNVTLRWIMLHTAPLELGLFSHYVEFELSACDQGCNQKQIRGFWISGRFPLTLSQFLYIFRFL